MLGRNLDLRRADADNVDVSSALFRRLFLIFHPAGDYSRVLSAD